MEREKKNIADAFLLFTKTSMNKFSGSDTDEIGGIIVGIGLNTVYVHTTVWGHGKKKKSLGAK